MSGYIIHNYVEPLKQLPEIIQYAIGFVPAIITGAAVGTAGTIVTEKIYEYYLNNSSS